MKELRLVLLGLAAVLALLLAGTFLLRAIRGPSQSTVATVPTINPETTPTSGPAKPPANAARAAVERVITDTPDYTRFFDRMRLVFPAEYETVVDELAAANAQKKELNPDAVMAGAIASLRRTRGTLAARATDDALAQIFALQLKEMKELETRDPHLCVAFLYGTNGPGFLTFAADHRPLVADVAIASLDAMNSGRMDNVQRAEPSNDDFQTLDKALVDKGLTRPQIDALLDGKTADPPIADDTMCKAGETYLETLAGLPPDVRARLYGLAVSLMTKS